MAYQVYKCKDCGAEFTEPKIESWYEYHSELDGPGPKRELLQRELCPECLSDMIDGGWYCDVCGEHWATDNGYGCYCDECVDKATESIEALQQALKTDYKTITGLFVEWAERHW